MLFGKINSKEKYQSALSTVGRLSSLVLAVALTSACQKNDGASVATGRAAGANTPAGNVADMGIQLKGAITVPTSAQNDFQSAVWDYLDVVVSDVKKSVGLVSADASGGTGVFFGGKIEMQSGVFNATNGANGAIRADSKLLVAIFDEYSGRPDPVSGQTVGAWEVGYSSAEGTVSGSNSINLKFYLVNKANNQKIGHMAFQGGLQNGNFQGVVSFNNYIKNDGTVPGSNWTFGNFIVPACQFFRCQ